MKGIFKWAAAAFAAMVMFSASAQAQTVDEIVKRGSINIGILLDLPPYGLLGADQQPQGYDVDVANLLAKAMGVKANIVQVTGPNRIPYLLSNKVDLIIGTFGINPERAKQVAFSIPYSAVENVMLGQKAKTIAKLEDLKGLKIGVPRASTQDNYLTQKLGNSAQILRFDDDASTFQALLAGQVDAVGEPGVIASDLLKANPDTPIETKFVLTLQPNGITMRRDQWNLLQWVNTFVYFAKQNGDLDASFQKWLGKPLPPLPTF